MFRSAFKAAQRVDGSIEIVGVGEGLVGQMMGFEIAPDGFDVVEFGRVFGQPFDGEPMGAFGQRGVRGLADMDRPVVEHENDRLNGLAGLRAIEMVEPLADGDEIAAALGARGV